jgi:hypothetical protein
MESEGFLVPERRGNGRQELALDSEEAVPLAVHLGATELPERQEVRELHRAEVTGPRLIATERV